MGGESSKIKNCCSCLEQTQIGENNDNSTYSSNNSSISLQKKKKQNMISLQQQSKQQSKLQSNLSVIASDNEKQIQNIILIGNQQSGKTTLINILKGNNMQNDTSPTQYPCMSMISSSINKQKRMFVLNEIDFGYMNQYKSSKIITKNEGFVFVIKYDNNKQNVQQQIRDFSKLIKTSQKPCAIFINVFTNDSFDIVCQEVKTLLSQYSINPVSLQIFNNHNKNINEQQQQTSNHFNSSEFLSDMNKLGEILEIVR